MVADIFFIFFGVTVLVIGPRWAQNMSKKFLTLGVSIDPSFFQYATMALGVLIIAFAIFRILGISRL